jgi:hypothetical protein
VHGRRPPRDIVLDMDSSVSPTHGEQEMSVWNGHYACTCYHPLFVFNQFGDLERCVLCVPATCTALTAGTTCSSLQTPRPLEYRCVRPCPGSATTFWSRSGSNTRFGYRPTRFCRARIGYLLTRPGGRPPHHVRRSHAISAIRPEPGPSRGKLPPRSSGIPENFIPASASS